MKFISHPKGIYLLFVTEMWERFSYFGMRALFMLYITKALIFDKETASQIYGSFTGLVYLTPLLGGYIADRYWGNRKSIVTGGMLIAIGQFLLFFSALYFQSREISKLLMFTGLGIMILGNGFFKPNISSMVGQLYLPNDSRKDAAYTIFYMGINIGASISPLWCGFVGDTGNPADFKWGFLSAGVGMLIGISVFHLLKKRYLITPEGFQIGTKPDRISDTDQSATYKTDKKPVFSSRKILYSVAAFILLMLVFTFNFSMFTIAETRFFEGADYIGAFIYSLGILIPVFIISDPSLTKAERSRILVIYIVSFFVIFFWSAFEQAGASLTFFADEQTNRNIFGWEMPASFFQSFNAVFVVMLAPVFAALWTWLGRRGFEPVSPVKQAMGLMFLSLGYLIIAFGVKGVEPGIKVSIFWLTGLYLMQTMGELCLSPIGLSLVNKLAPVRFASLLMGVWFIANAAANKFAGTLSSLYPEAGESKSLFGFQITGLFDFFIVFVVMSGIASVLLFLISKKLEKMMHGIR